MRPITRFTSAHGKHTEGGNADDGSRKTRLLISEPLLPLEPKVSDPQACGIVAYNALDIFRETFSGLSVDVERQCQLGAANALQLAQD